MTDMPDEYFINALSLLSNGHLPSLMSYTLTLRQYTIIKATCTGAMMLNVGKRKEIARWAVESLPLHVDKDVIGERVPR